MRFKKGSKVEVLNKKEVPSGSWWPAEIISGNGHNYYVRYNTFLANMCTAVERVPRKVIRPCPPSAKGPRDWVPGDILEVLDNNSWKLAEVSRVVDDGYFFVRLLGSCGEFKVHTSDLRLRQSWQDEKWVVIQKDSGKPNDRMMSSLSKAKKFKCQMPQPYLESHNALVFSRGTKKRPRASSQPIERCNEASRKLRAIEKDGRCERIFGIHSSQSLEKVDAVASPRTVLGPKLEACKVCFHGSMMMKFYAKMKSWSTGISIISGGCFISYLVGYATGRIWIGDNKKNFGLIEVKECK
ncbi:uncharacterized protein [Elaeis guineensis]|uniref:uncharacterized protein isoform X2 n=1 Tax=Elaeis guineensis var. tenera TaxID=51953 RepID=UPI003C6CDD70